jgi:hypothetical protein
MAVISLVLALGSCVGSAQEYPTALVRDTDPHVRFSALIAAPSAFQGRVIQLAGEIVRVESVGEEVVIWAKRKLIEAQPEYPGFRPEFFDVTDLNERFLLVYKGRVDPEGRRIGNKFITVAELLVPADLKSGTNNAVSERERLSFRARCLHVWKTGQKKISFFLDRYTQVFQPLEQDTYCVSGS